MRSTEMMEMLRAQIKKEVEAVIRQKVKAEIKAELIEDFEYRKEESREGIKTALSGECARFMDGKYNAYNTAISVINNL